MGEKASKPATNESTSKDERSSTDLLETWLAREIMKTIVVNFPDHPRGMRLGDIADEIGEMADDVLEMCEILVSAGKLEQSSMNAGFSVIHRFTLKSSSI